MEENIRFSIILYMSRVEEVFFRDCLDSIAAGTYRNFELVIVDASGVGAHGLIAEEFFPESGRLHYYRIRTGRTRGYGLSLATGYARGDYMVFMDCHSRMAFSALAEMAAVIQQKGADFIYSDNDELIGNDRMNPDFKSGPNTELIRHRNYIGEMFAVSKETILRIGSFRDALNYGCMYDYILRIFEHRVRIRHIPRLLFSKRIFHEDATPAEKSARLEKSIREHMTVVGAHLKRLGIHARIKPSKKGDFWAVEYDGSGYRNYRKDYLLVREGGTRVQFREAVSRMYGHMSQPDVGIVGGSFIRGLFTYDNCGYIFDTSGICYPACHGQSIFLDGYSYRCIIPQDVSVVDFGFCMIKKKVFRHLRGFDTSLTGRDMMLDFCLRTRRAGFRIVFEPAVRVTRRAGTHISSAQSNELLMEKNGDIIAEGDPYYNRNLPMGLENYFLY